mgnify:CR=1 FL=1
MHEAKGSKNQYDSCLKIKFRLWVDLGDMALNFWVMIFSYRNIMITDYQLFTVDSIDIFEIDDVALVNSKENANRKII